MNLQRVLTKLSVDVTETHRGYLVQVTSRYCESTISGGKIVHDVARYEDLAVDECRQLLEDISYQTLPGDEVAQHEPMSLFTLS